MIPRASNWTPSKSSCQAGVQRESPRSPTHHCAQPRAHLRKQNKNKNKTKQTNKKMCVCSLTEWEARPGEICKQPGFLTAMAVPLARGGGSSEQWQPPWLEVRSPCSSASSGHPGNINMSLRGRERTGSGDLVDEENVYESMKTGVKIPQKPWQPAYRPSV